MKLIFKAGMLLLAAFFTTSCRDNEPRVVRHVIEDKRGQKDEEKKDDDKKEEKKDRDFIFRADNGMPVHVVNGVSKWGFPHGHPKFDANFKAPSSPPPPPPPAYMRMMQEIGKTKEEKKPEAPKMPGEVPKMNFPLFREPKDEPEAPRASSTPPQVPVNRYPSSVPPVPVNRYPAPPPPVKKSNLPSNYRAPTYNTPVRSAPPPSRPSSSSTPRRY